VGQVHEGSLTRRALSHAWNGMPAENVLFGENRPHLPWHVLDVLVTNAFDRDYRRPPGLLLIVFPHTSILQFVISNPSYSNTGLPNANFNQAIFPYWDDLRTDGAGHGVFVKTEGTSPNQRFVIEWRANYYGSQDEAFFEVQLEESTNDIYIVYGPTRDNGATATTGIQQASGTTDFLQYSLNQAVLTNGETVRYGVLDNVPPTVSCSVAPDLLWAPNHQLVPVTVSLQVTDSGSGQNGVAFVGAASNQPQNELGDNNAANNIQRFESPVLSGTNGNSATYTDLVYLRAERSGKQKDGRTYTLTYRGSDMAENFTDCVVTVKVPHDQRPMQ